MFHIIFWHHTVNSILLRYYYSHHRIPDTEQRLAVVHGYSLAMDAWNDIGYCCVDSVVHHAKGRSEVEAFEVCETCTHHCVDEHERSSRCFAGYVLYASG